MRKLLLSAVLAASICTAASAQDSLQQKGVSYYGQPAAQHVYQQTSPGTGRAVTKTGVAAGAQQGRSSSIEVVSHGVRRTAMVHIPQSYDGRSPLPVILAFHGFAMHNYEMPPVTGLNGCGDRYGFLIVYPEAVGSKWDEGATSTDETDVDFVKDLIAALPRLAAIDRRRVYACGISNGGFFVQRLACELPGTFSAIAVVAATAAQRICNRCESSPLPIMFFNGTSDPLMPYDSSKPSHLLSKSDSSEIPLLSEFSGAWAQMSGFTSAPDAVNFWVHHNGASTGRTVAIPHLNRDNCRVTLEDYGSGRSEVAAYIIENGGHTWPGGLIPLPGKLLGSTPMDISASDLMCLFFRSH